MKRRTRVLKLAQYAHEADLAEMNASLEINSADPHTTDQLRGGMVCFICRRPLLDGRDTARDPGRQKTDEHILPSWLLREFDLDTPGPSSYITMGHGRKVRLPILVPCCTRCNGTMNRLIEQPIQDALRNGDNARTQEAGASLYAWMMKIMLGLGCARRSYRLHPDRRNRLIVGLSDRSWAGMNFYRTHLERICISGKVDGGAISPSILCLQETEGPSFGLQYDEARHLLIVKYRSIVIYADFGRRDSAIVSAGALHDPDLDTRIRAQQAINNTLPIRSREEFAACQNNRGVPQLNGGRQSWRPYLPAPLSKHMLITSAIRTPRAILLEGYMLDPCTGQFAGEENSIYFEIEESASKRCTMVELHHDAHGNIVLQREHSFMSWSIYLNRPAETVGRVLAGMIQGTLDDRGITLDIAPEALTTLGVEDEWQSHFWTDRMLHNPQPAANHRRGQER